MKALTLKQPWATMIAQGLKTIETRTWRTHYRGPFLITSSKVPSGPSFPGGVMICTAELVDCRPMTEADQEAAKCAWEPGRWAWILTNVRKLPPRPIVGARGLWDYEGPVG